MLGKFALTWDEFQPKMAGRFESLLQSREFSDVTLVSKDNTRTKAHKVILGSGSTFFNKILCDLKDHPHPLIYLMGVEVEVLEAIMSFLYLGEVEVRQELIQDFMRTASELQIDGLHSMKDLEVNGKEETKQPFIANETETKFDVRSTEAASKMSDMFNIKKRPAQEMPNEDSNDMHPVRETERTRLDINPLETKWDSSHNLLFPCDLCDFVSERKRDLRYHMGEKHRHEQASLKMKTFIKKGKDGLYWCTVCPKKFSDASNSRRHMAKVHYKILHFCTDCNYSSTEKAYVKHHHNNVHLGMKFPCGQCDHEATSPVILRIHERSAHE